jgi:hypothetical protein
LGLAQGFLHFYKTGMGRVLKGKGGRPRKQAVEGERYNVTARLPGDLRERFERAADEAGRSLSQQAEWLLTRALDGTEVESALGGGWTATVLRSVGDAARLLEEQTGRSWEDDYWTALAVRAATERIMAAASPNRPDGSQEEFFLSRERSDARREVERLSAAQARAAAEASPQLEALTRQLEEARRRLDRGPSGTADALADAVRAGEAVGAALSLAFERRRHDELLTREDPIPDGPLDD